MVYHVHTIKNICVYVSCTFTGFVIHFNVTATHGFLAIYGHFGLYQRARKGGHATGPSVAIASHLFDLNVGARGHITYASFFVFNYRGTGEGYVDNDRGTPL